MSEPRQSTVTVIGGGLAGSECAWQLAESGVSVRLVEQKPSAKTPAQKLDTLAELVCSNSFRGDALSNAVGLLKEEMRRAGSLIMRVGEKHRVAAGGAMAVDRERFSDEITTLIDAHPGIERVAETVTKIPDEGLCVIATGPLTGDALASDLAQTIGQDQLAYYDAIAPVVLADSINWDNVFMASRYEKGDADYVNCPLDKEQYQAFVSAIVSAEKVEAHTFEKMRFFEGCLPIEVMAERGEQTLAFGPMKPVGLRDPKTGKRPHAVLQLRAENAEKTAFNLVGCQTRMKWPEQKRVFRMIPGLEDAEFERLGSVHRNTFLHSPEVLSEDLELVCKPGVFLAGQITGVEGYVESAACGLVLGIRLGRKLADKPAAVPPQTTALGALLGHLRPHADRKRENFQPSNVVWSMFPPLPEQVGKRGRRGRKERREAMAVRALDDLAEWLASIER